MSSTHLEKRTPALIPLTTVAPELHVASLIVHARPQALAAVKDWLWRQPGVEVSAESEQGKLVVVMESEHAQPILDLIDATQVLAGVINAALVYHEVIAADEEIAAHEEEV
ncbi:MAG: chaperone NapD [Bacteroidales bacterium]|nr:chaperone NapD [Bacteroidales bacterium]